MSFDSDDFGDYMFPRQNAAERLSRDISTRVASALAPKNREYDKLPVPKRVLSISTDMISSALVGAAASYVGTTVVPAAARSLFNRIVSTTVVAGDVEGNEQAHMYASLLTWLKEQRGWSSLKVFGTFETSGSSIGNRYQHRLPTEGHMFASWNDTWYLVAFSVSPEQKCGDKKKDLLPTITIRALGGRGDAITGLFDHLTESSRERRSDSALGTFDVDSFDRDGDRCMTDKVPLRLLTSVALSSDVRKNFVDDVLAWEKQSAFYLANGIPFKRCYVLEGEPGCGKSTLAKVLASITGRDLWVARLAELTNNGVTKLFRNATNYGLRHGHGPIVLFEDFDDDATLRDRSHGGARAEKITTSRKRGNDVETDVKTRSLSGFLNAVDGVVPLHNVIIIMTTNTAAHIDPAVLRPGRTDKIVHVGAADEEGIRLYIDAKFGQQVFADDEVLTPIRGCRLQELYVANHDDIDAFRQAYWDFVTSGAS